jgi:glycosyltransferase involved in cell wall biosynthesis
MKILSLTNTTLDPSLGSGKTVLAWSQGLRALGHQVDVLPPQSYYHPWLKNKANRIKIRLDARKLSDTILGGKYDLVEFYGAEFGLLISNLSRISRENRPLLIAHTNGLELLANSLPNATKSKSRKPTLKGIGAMFLQPLLAKIDKLAFSRVDAFAAICEADMKFVVKQGIQPLDRCVVVEPGIDQAFLAAPWKHKRRQWLVSLASWTSRKDPETTVLVATQLLSQIPDLEFHIIGASGANQSILSAFDESFRSRIIVHPRLSQSDMVEVLTQAKVFLFPSFYEGFGMATTEAMACGCAVVVTPTGFAEAIRDGVDGFVCNFQDSSMMTARCLDLFLNEALRSRVSKAGRERVSELCWPVQVQKLEAKYKSWLQSF